MTNHDESTQDEAVTDSPAPVKRPSRWRIAVEAAWTGTMAAVMIWLAARFWGSPNWFDGIGMSVYGVFTGFFLATLVKTVQRRWAKRPTGYLDRDGERWEVRPDGTLGLPGSTASGFKLETVVNEWGPLTPIRD